MSRFAQALHEAIGERSVQEFADDCNLPYWVVRDLLNQKTRSPRVEHLPGFARGMKRSVEDLIQLIQSEEEVSSRLAPKNGRRGRKPTAST